MDFNVKNQIDPTALATVMQRKAAMEQEQANLERAEKNSRVSRILDAVVTGQQIATNMMNLAEKRQERKGVENARAIISEPSHDPILAPTRDQRLKEALLQATQKEGAQTLLSAQVKKDMPTAASGRDIRKISIPGVGQREVIVDMVRHTVHTLNGEDITNMPGVSEAVPAFAPAAVETGSGAVKFEERNTPNKPKVVSTTDGTVPPEKVGTVSDLTRLETRDRDKVFKVIETAKNDTLVAEGRKALKPLAIMRKAINEDNQALIDRMGGLFHKAATADVGNLAAYEQRDPNTRAIFDRLKNAGSMWVKGTPAKNTKAEILEALDTAETVITGTVADSFNLHADTVVESFPQLNREAVLDKMGAKEFVKAKKKLDIKNMSLEELKARKAQLEGKQ